MIVDSRSKPLNHSEERYRFLFDSSPAAVYSIDASGVIQDFNLCAAELWGRSPDWATPTSVFADRTRCFVPTAVSCRTTSARWPRLLPERCRRLLTGKSLSFDLTVRELRWS